MSERASFILGRALPLGVFGFLLAIQAELAYSGVEQAVAGQLGRAEAMYLLNRVLTVVFFAFLLNPDRVSKEFALLLGIAIITDALLMRMTLVPALLTLLGERAWAMPAWLDKLLPRLTIEPPGERVAPEPVSAAVRTETPT